MAIRNIREEKTTSSSGIKKVEGFVQTQTSPQGVKVVQPKVSTGSTVSSAPKTEVKSVQPTIQTVGFSSVRKSPATKVSDTITNVRPITSPVTTPAAPTVNANASKRTVPGQNINNVNKGVANARQRQSAIVNPVTNPGAPLQKAQVSNVQKNDAGSKGKLDSFIDATGASIASNYARNIANLADMAARADKGRAISDSIKTNPDNFNASLGLMQSMPSREELAQTGMTDEQIDKALNSLNGTRASDTADMVSEGMGRVADQKAVEAERNSRNLNRLENFASRSISGAINQAPQMILNMAAPGSGDLWIAATSYADAYNDAESRGIDSATAAGYGALVAGIEVASNYISSANKFDPKGILDDWQDALVANSGAKGGKALLMHYALNVLGEQIEEEAATIPEFLVDYFMLKGNRTEDGKFDWKKFWKEIGQTFIDTLGSTVVLGGLTGEYSRANANDFLQSIEDYRNADPYQSSLDLVREAVKSWDKTSQEDKNLTLRAVADMNGEDPAALSDRIEEAVENAKANGILETESEAEVSSEAVPENTAQENPAQLVSNAPVAQETPVRNEIADALVQQDRTPISEYEGEQIFRSALDESENAMPVKAFGKRLGRDIVVVEDLPLHANGVWMDGKIYIPESVIRSGKETWTVVRHELTHSLRGAKVFDKYINYAVDQMRTQMGDNWENYYNQKVQDYSRAYAGAENFDSLINEEIAAEYTQEYLFNNQEAVNQLVRSSRSTAQRIWQTLKDMARKLTGIDSPEAAAIRRAERMFAQAIAETNDSKNETNDTLFTLRSMREDIDSGVMENTLIESGVFDPGEASSFVANIEQAMKLIEPKRNFMDLNEDYGKDERTWLPFKQNSDKLYKVSMDFSTLCKKRIITQAIIERLNVAREEALDAKTQFAIEESLRRYQSQYKGLQVACALCYVEAARLKSPKTINQFLRNRTENMVNYYAQAKGSSAKQIVDEAQVKLRTSFGLDPKISKEGFGRALAGMTADEFHKRMSFMGEESLNKLLNEVGYPVDNRTGLVTAGKAKSFFSQFNSFMRKNTVEAMTPEQRNMIEIAESLPAEKFLTADGLTELKREYPDIYNAFNRKVSSATRSKALEQDTPYYFGDASMVSQSLIDEMNKENGLRTQSWSDFQLEHLLDQISAIADLSTRGAKMHGYTKVPEFVEVNGHTGLMINNSLIPEGRTGMDENGNLIFSPTEGMPIETADDLRSRFAATDGNIAIGINDEQILKLLEADNIDYVIPYHRSGLCLHLRQIAKIDKWSDYTKSQNERVYDPSKGGKETSFSDWFTDDYYSDPRSGIEIMREAQQKYLDLCYERGLVPKFSQFLIDEGNNRYSIPIGADGQPINYWKMLIDRKMINQETGEIIEQKAVRPEFNWEDEVDSAGNVINRGIYSIIEQAEDPRMQKMVDDLTAMTERNLDNGYIQAIIDRDEGVQRAYEVYNMTHDDPQSIMADAENDEYEWTGDIKEGLPQKKEPAVSAPYRAAARFSLPSTQIDSEGETLSRDQQDFFKDSKVRDEDGNLRVVYHGTDADFTVFDRTKSRANMDIQGNFFSPWEIDAGGYGENVKAYYLNITNPAPESIAYGALRRFQGQNGAGVKAREFLESLGYDGVNNGDEEYIAFYPEQIKEVSNLRPTQNPDVRFSLPAERYDNYSQIPGDVEGNYGFHAGNLGKAESRGSQGYYRGTGHYGTGTYFVGNPQELRYGYDQRPVETVDFSNYNLFAPQNSDDAYTLHEYLRALDGGLGNRDYIDSSRIEDIRNRARENVYLNDYSLEDVLRSDFAQSQDGRNLMNAADIISEARALMGNTFDDVLENASRWAGMDLTEDMSDLELAEHAEVLEAIDDTLGDGVNSSRRFNSLREDIADMYEREPDVARMTGRSPEEIRNIARNSNYDMGDADPYRSDSMATRFMRDLGYEGIDTRGLPDFDNTRYGSVIYDLKGRDLERKNANSPRFSFDNAKIPERRLDSIANSLKRQFNTKMDINDLKQTIGELYDMYDMDLTEDERREVFRTMAREMESQIPESKRRDAESQGVLEKLKERPISLTESQRSEIVHTFGSMNDFRKEIAPLKLRSDGIDLETAWKDWSNSASTLGMFDSEVNPLDMPAALVDLVERLKGSRELIDHDDRVDQIVDYLENAYQESVFEEPDIDLYEAANGGWNTKWEQRDPTDSAEYKELMGDDNDGDIPLTDIRSAGFAQQIQGNKGMSGFDTLKRTLDKAAGGNQQIREWFQKVIERPLYDAKAAYTRNRITAYNNLDKVVNEYGIKAGTKESAAVQWYGEGYRVNDDGTRQAYTLNDLKQEFPDTWQNIQKMEQWCRNQYNEYVDKINGALESIYPDVEEKALAKLASLQDSRDGLVNQARSIEEHIRRGETSAAYSGDTLAYVQRQISDLNTQIDEMERSIRDGSYLRNKRLIPRTDYFHHFNEVSNKGIGGLKNLLRGQMTLIDTELVGKSDTTKPKSKWMSFLQSRGNGEFTADAVGGMARYMPGAEFVIAMDPAIAHMRAVIKELATSTKKTRNANGLISYLTNYTNDIAGKTAGIDRSIMNLFGEVDGRAKLDAIRRLNSRFKANAVGGNIRSALAQFSNIPTALGVVKSESAWIKGLRDYLDLKVKRSSDLLDSSEFMTERYFDDSIDRFTEDSFGKKIKQFSNAMLEFGDREAAQWIWFSAYEEALEQGVEDPVFYADQATQQSVGGRGVGEVPYNMSTKIVNLLAPFQVEVNNTWQQMKKMVSEKDAKGLMRFMIGSFVMESMMEQVFGIDVIPDFLGTMIDTIIGAWREKDEEEPDYQGVIGKGIRDAIGEIIGAIPGASLIAPVIFGIDSDTGEALFGEGNPSRYGTGLGGLSRLSSTAAELVKAGVGEQELGDVDLFGPMVETLLPFGGRQLTRTYQTAQDLGLLPAETWGNIPFAGGEYREVPGSYTNSGALRFELPSSPETPEDVMEMARALMLGEYSTQAGREYLETRKPQVSASKMEKINEYAGAGYDPQDFIDFYASVDSNGNGSISQAEAQEYLDSTDLDNDQKLMIWTLIGPNWKKNPYA